MTAILLIEDAEGLSQVIARELGAAGYSVAQARDGAAGIESFDREVPDLVILDWMLPKLDGLEVLKRIRATSAVPVLMLTARGEEADRVIGLELGADDYLVKPFSVRELVARVRALLRRMEHVRQVLAADRTPSRAALHYGPLTLYPEAYRTMLGGEPVELTRTEFDLLHLLLRNPGRAFGRAYLLDAVWGEQYFPGDRSVDNAVLRLRRKLRTLGEAIETVWGVGYRLRAERR
jgi:DNA-binding response OmpR family regulator